jgi:signal transduction histidine kinase
VEFGGRFGGIGHDRTTWLVLLCLLLGVLAPTACVLWFMNEASKSQAIAARQQVTDAYRNELRVVRDQVESFWEARAAALHAESPADFQRIVKSGLADSLVFPGQNAPRPSITSAENPQWTRAQTLEDRRDLIGAAAAYARLAESDDVDLAARAAQGQIRCLLQSGDKSAALQAIRSHFARISIGRDLQGRLIAADEQLLALHLLKPNNRAYSTSLRRLTSLLNDYNGPSMPSAQRLFLMREVRMLDPQADFPTYAAESLAEQFLEADGATAGDQTLQPSGVQDVWKIMLPGGRAVALFRKDTVVSAMRHVLDQQNLPRSVKFEILAPAAASARESIAAGRLLPGWQVSFSLLDTKPYDTAARRRMASYIWVGFLVIAALGITGLIVGQAFRRQLRLTHLKTDLIAAVSHELKTPLASMRLLVDSLLDDEQFDAKKTRDYLQLIAGENLRLTRLIENFLTFARIERDRQKFAFVETRPEAVIESAVQVMRERLRSPTCHLEVDISPDLPRIQADEDALVMVLLNLLDNAYKYTPPERGDKRILLHAYREAGQVIFEVEDNGIGIAPRDQKRIFRRFYQVDQRLARATGGCGLGLSIVEFIARAHGGAVRVKSQPGAGSTFRVSLPCDSGAVV